MERETVLDLPPVVRSRAEVPAGGNAPSASRASTWRRRPELLLKAGIWLLGLAPVLWGVHGFFSDSLGANPIEALLLAAGDWTLVFLLLTLAVTPVRRLTHWNRVVKVRRLLGLFAFFYASLHFLVYLGLDQGFAWSFIVEDVMDRPFITVGFTAFLLLLPLALTSTRGWIRRLGKRWQRLHRLVYVAAALGVLHFYWKVKADTLWPLVAAGVLAGLMLLRMTRTRTGSAARVSGSSSRSAG